MIDSKMCGVLINYFTYLYSFLWCF